MIDVPVCYRRPDGPMMLLREQPRLASWDAASMPGQVRLKAFLRHAEMLARPACATVGGPAALRLDVGLAPTVDLLHSHDLDNYLFPLATMLTKNCGTVFASVWCSKRHAETSRIAIAEAEATAESSPPRRWLHAYTTASSTSGAYKQQIHNQLAGEPELPDGPVALELSFRVGPRRSWPNLWKPTIDALGRLLGYTDPRRQWHPRDGRIVELGMHCHVDPTMDNEVHVAIASSHEELTIDP